MGGRDFTSMHLLDQAYTLTEMGTLKSPAQFVVTNMTSHVTKSANEQNDERSSNDL